MKLKLTITLVIFGGLIYLGHTPSSVDAEPLNNVFQPTYSQPIQPTIEASFVPKSAPRVIKPRENNTLTGRANHIYYKKLAHKLTKGTPIPADCLFGLWLRESQLQPYALGDKNWLGQPQSFGLGQVQVPTARRFFPSITSGDLLNPWVNGRVTVRILTEYHKKYRGNFNYILAAYNAGERKVDIARKNKRLPHNYSRYVKKVYQLAKTA